MPEPSVAFKSSTLTLAGNISLPEGVAAGERRPAFIVLHGFGSNRNADNVLGPCRLLNELGYVTLRFDMRGCGESTGERGNLICLEQVEDTRNALSFLAEQKQVDPDRIGVLGSSFGAAVAVYAGAVDQRVAAVISASGWGHGERKFRGQHASPEAWAKFTAMLAAGRGYRQKHDKPLMVPRYDIVPMPEQLRGHVVPGSIQEFTWETAQGMYDFRPEDVVAEIAPRPLLLLHSAADTVTPTEQSIALFQKARQPADLHLFAETDHFMFAQHNTRVRTVVQGWLEKFFPLKA